MAEFCKTCAKTSSTCGCASWENANAGVFVEIFAQIKNTRGYLKFNIGFHCLLHVLEAAKMFVALHIYCAEQ